MEENQPIAVHKKDLIHVGKVFDAPLAVKGNSWLPLTQILLWGIMSWFAGICFTTLPLAAFNTRVPFFLLEIAQARCLPSGENFISEG